MKKDQVYALLHKEERKKRLHKWYIKNKEKLQEKHKEYRRTHKVKQISLNKQEKEIITLIRNLRQHKQISLTPQQQDQFINLIESEREIAKLSMKYFNKPPEQYGKRNRSMILAEIIKILNP